MSPPPLPKLQRTFQYFRALQKSHPSPPPHRPCPSCPDHLLRVVKHTVQARYLVSTETSRALSVLIFEGLFLLILLIIVRTRIVVEVEEWWGGLIGGCGCLCSW